jgi:hypothetical protein
MPGGEASRLGMAVKQTAQHFSRARHHRHRQVTAHGQVTGGQAEVGCGQAVARVLKDIVGAHDPFVEKGRCEHRRRPWPGQVGKVLRLSA